MDNVPCWDGGNRPDIPRWGGTRSCDFPNEMEGSNGSGVGGFHWPVSGLYGGRSLHSALGSQTELARWRGTFHYIGGRRLRRDARTRLQQDGLWESDSGRVFRQ